MGPLCFTLENWDFFSDARTNEQPTYFSVIDEKISGLAFAISGAAGG